MHFFSFLSIVHVERVPEWSWKNKLFASLDNTQAASNWFVGGMFAAMGVFPLITDGLSRMESRVILVVRSPLVWCWSLGHCWTMIGMLFVVPAFPSLCGGVCCTRISYWCWLFVNVPCFVCWAYTSCSVKFNIGLLLPSGKLYYALFCCFLGFWVHRDEENEEENGSQSQSRSRSRSRSCHKTQSQSHNPKRSSSLRKVSSLL